MSKLFLTGPAHESDHCLDQAEEAAHTWIHWLDRELELEAERGPLLERLVQALMHFGGPEGEPAINPLTGKEHSATSAEAAARLHPD